MLFKSDDFESMYTDPETQETYPAWKNDFEARFPSDKWENITQLKTFVSWVLSTDRTQATGDDLAEAVTYDGVEYTKDTAEYRLAKFKAEFADYAEVSSFVFYYVFTELFLMVDSRAKNFFLGFHGSTCEIEGMRRKAVAEPYDMDTGLGTNNEGTLTFSYYLEDTDTVAGADVFNGQKSVLWNNLRDTQRTAIVNMYQTLRSQGTLSYTSVETRFEEHQNAWPEAVWNEDANVKYIEPLVNPEGGKEPTDFYLPMAQGDKRQQRRWWMRNRFAYMDSKWNAGDALSQVIQLRGYAKSNITVTPYINLYPTVKYGSYLVQLRGTAGTPATLVCPLDNVDDTEIYIYSAPHIANAGDLSGLKVGVADFSQAVNIQEVKVGDASVSYDNPNMKRLGFGSNVLLKKVDARNCSGLGTDEQKTVDMSNCSIIEEVYFDGTSVQGVTLPNGGVLRILHLPATVTNLTLLNQKNITDLTVAGYSNISTLRIENSSVDSKGILNSISSASRVRLIGFYWECTNAAEIESILDKLDTMRGLDETGGNVDKAQVSGTIHTSALTGAQIASYNARYPYLTVTADTITSYLYYYNGTTLYYTETIRNGADGTYTGIPTKAQDVQYTYTFAGWSRTNDNTPDTDARENVLADRNVYACYTETLRTYTVRWYNGTTLLETDTNVPYDGSAAYDGTTPVDPSGQGLNFTEFVPNGQHITGNTDCYAQFAAPEPEHTITDTWSEIFQHIALGDYSTRYSIGDTMSLNLGSEGYINMEIVAFDTDVLASDSTKTAPITWVSEQMLKTEHRMNPATATNYKFEEEPSFLRHTTNAANSDYNRWNAQNIGSANNTAKISFTITAVTDGTLIIRYVTGYAAGNSTSLKVNGTEIVSQYSGSVQDYNLTIVNGTSYEIEFENTKLTASDSTSANIRLTNTSYQGAKTAIDALVTQSTPVITNCLVLKQGGYQTGTGAVGGYAISEMRDYIQNTIKPLIPTDVRSHIVSVTKYTRSTDTTGTVVNNVESTEDVWLLSNREVNNTSNIETLGPIYSTAFPDPDNASRIKYVTGSSTTNYRNWWLRSVFNFNNFYYVNTNGAVASRTANNTHGVVIGFCT